MDIEESAIARWLEIDSVRYIYLREFYKRGARICCSCEDGIALKADRYNIVYTAGNCPECEELYTAELCLVDNAALKDRLMAAGRFSDYLECSQALYLSPDRAPVRGDIEITALTMDDVDFVVENYHNPGAYRAHIAGRISDGMLGAKLGGRLAGFVGVHMEGTLGLLEVLPEFRRRGVGEALEAAMINRLLDKGFVPYGHIKAGNEASFKLQEKLGLTIDPRRVYWLI